ncbi:MAG: hypothetical protein II710_05810 [Clostridia bacterium]|nr:hypothetical protein [Clostridia bacterium]
MQDHDNLNQADQEIEKIAPENGQSAEPQESAEATETPNSENQVFTTESPAEPAATPANPQPRKKFPVKLLLAILIPALVLCCAASALLLFFHAPMDPDKAFQDTTEAFLSDYQDFITRMNDVTKDPDSLKTDAQVVAVMELPGQSTGLAADLKVNATLVRSGEDILLDVHVFADKKEAYLTCGKTEDVMGFSIQIPLPEKVGLKKSMAGSVRIKGLAESFRASPFNPANNPDSGLTQEQFDSLEELCQALEKVLDPELKDEQSENEGKLLSDLLTDFINALMKKASVRTYSTFPQGQFFALFHPEKHLEVSLDEEALSSIPGIIRELLKDPKYDFFREGLNTVLQKVQFGDLQADDADAFLDELQKSLDRAHPTFSYSVVSVDGRITGLDYSAAFSLSEDPVHPQNERLDISLRAEYGNGRDEASVKKAELTVEAFENDELQAHAGLDYTCEKTAAGTPSGQMELSLTERSETDPSVQKGVYHAEMQFGDGLFSLSLGDNTIVKGSYAFPTQDDGTPSFQLTLNDLAVTQMIPQYSISSGISFEKKEIRLSDFLTLSVQKSSGVALPDRALKMDLLDSANDPVTYLQQSSQDCLGAATEYAAYAMAPKEDYIVTADGYRCKDVSQVNNDYERILDRYIETVNDYYKRYSIEDPSLTTCLLQSTATGLWFYLYVDWSEYIADAWIYVDPPQEMIQMVHPAKIESGKMVIHEWDMQDEIILSCSEPDYKIGICSLCGSQLKLYQSEEPSLPHIYSQAETGFEFDPETGKNEKALYRTCKRCGQAEVEFKSYIFKMDISDGRAIIISGSETKSSGDPSDHSYCLAIPQYADKDHKIPVTEIGGPVHVNSTILFIPDGVRILHWGAFQLDNSDFNAVFIPKSVGVVMSSPLFQQDRVAYFYEGNEEDWSQVYAEQIYVKLLFGWPDFPFAGLYESEEAYEYRCQHLYDFYHCLYTNDHSEMQSIVGSQVQVYGIGKSITVAEYDPVADRIVLLKEDEIVLLDPRDVSVVQTFHTKAKSISADAGLLAVGESEYPDGVTLYDLKTFEVFKVVRMPQEYGIQSILEVALDGDMLIVLGKTEYDPTYLCFYDIRTGQCKGSRDYYNNLALDRNSHTVWALKPSGSPISCSSFNTQTGDYLSGCWDLKGFKKTLAANNFWFDGLNPTAYTFARSYSTNFGTLPTFQKYRIELPDGVSELGEESFIDDIPDGYMVISVISGGSNGGIEAAVLYNEFTGVWTLVRYEGRTVMLPIFSDRAIPCGDRILLFTKGSRFVFILDPSSF